MEDTDALHLLLRWNVSEMHRRFFFPQAYADAMKVAQEREVAMELRRLLIATNLRDIHDRSLRMSGGKVVFGFWAPLSTLDYVKYTVRHMEIAINARVQYKIKEADQRVYVAILPWIPNVAGSDVDAFFLPSFPLSRYLQYVSLLFWLLWSFILMLTILEGPRRLFGWMIGIAIVYWILYLMWIVGRRLYINAWLASLEPLLKRDVEDGFL